MLREATDVRQLLADQGARVARDADGKLGFVLPLDAPKPDETTH